MRRLHVLAVLSVVVFALVGCGGGEEDSDGTEASAGATVFTEQAEPTCASCHTLADAGSGGTIGPNLDDLQPSADRVLRALENGPGAMPDYGDALSEQQKQALADYVSSVAGQ